MTQAIGIDLGMTSASMALASFGDPEVIENADGRRSTPAVVAAIPGTGERLVGSAGRRQAVSNPENTIKEFRRFIGKRYDDPVVRQERRLVDYRVEPLANGDAGIVFGGELLRPAEICAMVLRKLKEDAEAKLGARVTQAVITVPAYFNHAQRDASRAAARIAGLEVLRIVKEPTAAALAHGLDLRGNRTIAVFAMGATTFDITILDLEAGVFEVLSTNGDTYLGGDDFSLRIVDWMLDLFQEREMIDLRKSSDRSPMQRVREEAERVKTELSSDTTSYINLPYLTADTSGPKHFVHQSLTRAEFERMVAELVEYPIASCEQAMRDAGAAIHDIDDLLLVGGATRMPAIKARITEFFQREPSTLVNPEETVALGAAIVAEHLSPKR